MARIPIKFTTHPHLKDHHFMGQAVLPAVEAMEILADAVQHADPQQSVTTIANAHFDKFLTLDMSQAATTAFVNLQPQGTGEQHVELATKTKAPKAAITRTKIHAQLTFGSSQAESGFVPLDVAAAPEGICTFVDPEKIYADLVPFGTAYANIKTPVLLSPDGALAVIECPNLPTTTASNHLGSPFALDAAFHAACVWGQHYHGIVAFPVAMDQRRVLLPTQPNSPYYARVLPKKINAAQFIFDLWLLDESGRVREMVKGLKMRDVSGGRLKPPAWIVRPNQPDPLAGLRINCQRISLVELDAVAPYASEALSPREAARFTKMGFRRKRSYLSARMALKRLSRRLQNDNMQIAPETLTTLKSDLVKPHCPVQSPTQAVWCSVSHNRRFAIAVAADHPVGVDVEVISPKAVKFAHIYMSAQEITLMQQSNLGKAEAAARVWTLKEAVAKATGMNLATAWQQAQVNSIGEHQSRFDLKRHAALTARHATVGDHLFTLFNRRV